MKEYKFKINGNSYNVTVNSVEGNIADVTVNGASYKVEMENAPVASQPSAPAAPVAPVQIAAAQQNAPAQAAPTAPAAPAAPATPKAAGSGKAVTAPLPGVIIEVSVKVGDAVKAGDQVAVLEAMKMENAIEATCDGTVTSISVNKGYSVLEGAPIVTIG